MKYKIIISFLFLCVALFNIDQTKSAVIKVNDFNGYKDLPIVATNLDKTILAIAKDGNKIYIHIQNKDGKTKALRKLKMRERVYALAVTTGGSHLFYTGTDKAVGVYHIYKKQYLRKISALPNTGTALCINSDNTMVYAADTKGHIIGISTRTWKKAVSFPHKSIMLYSLSLSPNGKYLAAGGKNALLIYELNNSNPKLKKVLQLRTENKYLSNCFTDNNTVASGDDSGRILIWDIHSGKLKKTIDKHTHWVWYLERSDDGRLFLSSSIDQSTITWSTSSYKAYKGVRLSGSFYYAVGYPQVFSTFKRFDYNWGSRISNYSDLISFAKNQNSSNISDSEFDSVVSSFKSSYPDVYLSVIDFEPNYDMALVKALEDCYGKYILEYSAANYYEIMDKKQTEIIKNEFIMHSPFLRVALAHEAYDKYGSRTYPIQEDFGIKEIYYLSVLNKIEENKDYVVIAKCKSKKSKGYRIAVASLYNNIKANLNSDSNNIYEGYSAVKDIGEAGVSKQIARIVAFINLVTTINLNIDTGFARVKIRENDSEITQGLDKYGFASKIKSTNLKNIFTHNIDYDEKQKIFKVQIAIPDSEILQLTD